MSKSENTKKPKDTVEIMAEMKKKKQLSPKIISFFETLETIISTEAEPLIKKIKSDSTNQDNLEKLRHLYIAFETINSKITQYSHERISKTLGEANNIKSGGAIEEESEEDNESSESSEISSEDEKQKPQTKKKEVVTKGKNKLNTKKNETETEESSSEESSSDE
jgi:hypothetical protein